LVSARSILEEMPQGHPFAQALVRRDLELAVQSLKQQSRPVFGPD
jgi:hypothetical protein